MAYAISHGRGTAVASARAAMRQFIIIILVVALALLLPYSLKAQEQADFKGESLLTAASGPTA